MIRSLRQYGRLTCIMAWSFFMVTLRLALIPFRPISPRFDRVSWQFIYHRWMLGVAWLLGMRAELRGVAPQRPYFLVSNHLTFVDVFLLGSQLGCVFVARSDVKDWPVFGFLAKHGKTMFINRDRPKDALRVNEEIAKTMDEGFGVVVFAEGGVSQTAQVRDFKPALLDPAAKAGLPVYYATVYYETPDGYPPASEVIVWRDPLSFFGHFCNVAGLPHFNAVVTIGGTPITGPDRKQLAESLCAAVRAQFTPLR